MRLRIQHRTEYRYAAPPRLALLRVRLWPRSGAYGTVEAWSVSVEGASAQGRFRDAHDNDTALYALEPGADRIVIEAAGTVATHLVSGVVSGPDKGPGSWVYRRATALTGADGAIRQLGEGLDGSLSSLHALSARVREAIAYRTGATGADTTAAEALRLGAGVCQDHAHAFLAAARGRGVPARYVSGYLRMDDREEQEASHAWVEAHVEGLGWVGFDVSNGHSPDERYVALARGLDYRDAAPVSGIVRAAPGSETMRVDLVVATLPDTPIAPGAQQQ